MKMDYETAQKESFTRAQVERELKLHGTTWGDFIADNPRCAKSERIKGAVVLQWLGY